MATIKATCPFCGDVSMPHMDITLYVIAPVEIERSHYSFICPSCSEEVRKPADDGVVAILIQNGVKVVASIIPDEALEDHAGPALEYDDVLDFTLALSREDDLIGLLLGESKQQD